MGQNGGEGYPFPYLGHGNTIPWDWMLILICFEKPPSDRAAIERGIPNPLRPGTIREMFSGLFMDIEWDGRFFALSNTTEGMHASLKLYYLRNWRAFQRRVERWLLNIHKLNPIQFAFREWAEGDPSVWHEWSVDNIPERILPPLFEYREMFIASGGDEEAYNPVKDMIQYDLLIPIEANLVDILSDNDLVQELLELLEWLPDHPYNSDAMSRKVGLIRKLQGGK
jgi:hypothetical protein